jgi:general secretion pathway protein K
VSRTASPGFVAPLVAIALALLSLSVWSAAEVSAGMNRQLRLLRAQLRLETAAASAEARIAHLALTEPLSQRAIRVGAVRFGDPATDKAAGIDRLLQSPDRRVSELVLDGRTYQLALGALPSDIVHVEVQDEAGLLNLNGASEEAVARMLALLAVEPERTRRLAGALADFTDPDDLRRLNGAEEREYRLAGLRPPRNAPLHNVSSVISVLGWRDALTRPQQLALAQVVTARSSDRRLNLNTASILALRAALAIDPRAAQAILAAREGRALSSAVDIGGSAGITPTVGEALFGGLPDNHLRLTVRFASAAIPQAFVYRTRLILGRTGADRPAYWQRAPLTRDAQWRGVKTRVDNGDVNDLPQSPSLSPPSVR